MKYRGKKVKKNIIIYILIIVFSFGLYASWNPIDRNSEKEMFQTFSSESGLIQVEFSLDGYEIENQEKDGKTYQRISYSNEGDFAEVGKPDLPRFSRLVAIPNHGEVSIEVTSFDKEVISDITIYPRQPLKIDGELNDFPFTIDNDFYSGVEIFPSAITEIGEPAIMRDYRVVNVTINPFQYDPQKKELSIFSNVTLQVHTSGTGGVNCKLETKSESSLFSPLYKSSIINYEEVRSRGDEFKPPTILFIYPQSLNTQTSWLDSLVLWKHRKGFNVVKASTAETGTSMYNIKSYIQDAYDTWENRPDFVCLVGDASGSYSIPTGYSGYGEGDQVYTLLEGNDILADVWIGRLSISGPFDLQTIVYKILHYEREPYMANTNWYERALLVGDPSSSGPSTISTSLFIKELIYEHNDNFVFDEVYGGSFVSQMATSFNTGVSCMNYRGYWGMSGWSNSNTLSLNNGFMLPFAMFLTCGTGSFASETSRNEVFLRAGAPGTPKGAIGAVGTATLSTHTCFNNVVCSGTFYGIFAEGIYYMGGALNRGKIALYNNFAGSNLTNYVSNFSYWNNLMGDPSLELWTGVPQPINVFYETNVSLGTNFLEIFVTQEFGIALEGAWVTILKGEDEIFASGLTDADGMIILPINTLNTGEAFLTVTKHNYIPHLGNFNIEIMNQFVNISNIMIDDDNSGTSSGNSDGNINPGEDIELLVNLKNFGTNLVSDVTATLSSDDPDVTITDDYEEYGAILPGAFASSSDDFDFSVSNSALGGSEIEFDLLIEDSSGNSWIDKIYLTVFGVYFDFTEYTIIGGNNQLDPGETVQMTVTLENIGAITASGISGTLISNEEAIEIDDADGFFGTILPNHTGTNNSNTFQVTANTQIIPGSQFTLDLELFNASGFFQTLSFILEVGEVSVTDPLGPDGYGYYCYDDGDIDYYKAPTYNWIEIDPTYGGPGTILPMNDNGNNGDIEVVTLPFNLRFYGEDYSEISICSNGYISPGISEEFGFMNMILPGPLGPSPMIAPFWDDLMISNGKVCYYFDSALNYFVVEWSRLKNEYNGYSEETFEVILYDINFYPSSSGDNEIMFQYHTINNVDVGSYPSQYGQYASVGLEDHTALIGLEYTFNNQYPTAAKPLENEMAILFTGPPIPLEEPYLVIGGTSIIDTNGNGKIDFGEDIELFVLANNMGENAATGVSAVLSSSDPYITLGNTTSNYNNILGGTSGNNLDAFTFNVQDDIPDGHLIPFMIEITSDQNVWNLTFTMLGNAPQIEFTSLFVDDGDNNLLDPGETADILVSYTNQGGADAYNTMLDINTSDPFITLNSSNFNFGTFSSGVIGTAVFNVTANSSTPIGHIAPVHWNIVADNNYSSNGVFNLNISQVPVMVTEYFNTFPPAGWYVEGTGNNWSGSNTSNAGGTSPEAEFSWSPSFVGEQRLVTPEINTLGSSTLDLEFKFSVNHYSSSYTIGVSTTSDGSTWNTAWDLNVSSSIPATTQVVTISTPDVGSETFQLAFFFNGDSWNTNYWYLDNVIIGGGNPPLMGYIQGDVTLNGGAGNVEDVQITAGSFVAHPNSEGDYILPVTPGTYDVTASLIGYEPQTSTNVVVVELQTTMVNFILEPIAILNPPENLVATVYENNVELNWDAPEEIISDSNHHVKRDKLSHFDKLKLRNNSIRKLSEEPTNLRVLSGYKIYRNEEMIHEITDPSTTIYLDENLDGGEYTYYVVATYDEGDSEPSNIQVVEIILPVPINLTFLVMNENVNLNWQAPNTTIQLTGYNVYRDDDFLEETIFTLYVDENVPIGTHTYYITALYGSYESGPSNEVIVEMTETDMLLAPVFTYLSGNHPNPFNPTTTINFALKEAGNVRVDIFNIKGEKVCTLLDKYLEADYHSVVWNGKDDRNKSVSSGIYFYKMKVGDKYTRTKKMIMMK